MEVSGRKVGKGKPFHSKLLCDPCSIDSLHEDALYYCINCNEFLCDNCTNNHKKSKASRNHKLLDKDAMPSDKIETVREKLCPKHNAEMSNYFCSRHKGFCCTVCVTIDHVNCPVQYMNEIAKSEEYKGLLQHINDTESQLVDHVTRSKQTKVKVGELFDQLQASLNLFRAEINVELDALVTMIMSEAQQIKTDDLNSMEFKLTLLESTLNELRDVSSNLKKLEIYQQHRNLFISAKEENQRIPNPDAKILAHSEEVSTLEIAERSQEEIMNRIEIETVYARGVAETEPHTEMATNRKDPKSNTANFVKQINIKHISDKAINRLMKTRCSITGIEVLDINTLVLADHENYCIKVVDLKTDRIVYCFKLDKQQHDLTSISLTRIVAACDTELVFLLFDACKLSIEKKLPVHPGYRGIVYHNNTLLLTFAGEQPCVKVLDLNGNAPHVYAYDADGQQVFSDPRYIAVSTDGRTMFISDRDMHSLTIMDMKGNVISTYTHENLKCPTGLIQDDNGNILVAGSSTKNIHRISQKGSLIQIVLDNIEWPQAVAYSYMDNMLYITRCSSSFISVYKIE